MIKEIFLPEKIGTQRIFAQRIVGLALHDDVVRISLIYAKRNRTFIEKLREEAIEPGSDDTYADRVAQAIKKIILSIKSYNQVRVCIPASIVVFKELQLQFSDPEKIRMILDFEIESMLPFSINEAVVDFIITKTQKEDQSAQVLVAAVRNQDLQTHLSIYQKAGIDPTSITIDLFAVYGLYQQIPEYVSLPHATALVEIGKNTTRVAFLQHGQLRLTRYIQRGIATVIKLISEEAKVTTEEIEQKLSTSGLKSINDDAIVRIMQKHFVLLLNDIQFTLNSFSLKLNFYDGVSKVLFTGSVYQIAEFMTFCSDTMQIPCEIFGCQKLLSNKSIKSKIKEPIEHWADFAIALGAGMPSVEQSYFDLRRGPFAVQRHGLIVKQLATACTIIIIMLATIGVKGYLDLRQISEDSKMFELREINRIKQENIFPKERFPKQPTLASVVREGEKIVREKSDIWAPFAQQKMRPLDLWIELTRIINKKQFDVTIREVTFTTDEKNWEKEKDGTVKKDLGIPKIEVDGTFRSKVGSHFEDWGQIFEPRFKDSQMLKVIEPIDATPAPESGVNFVAKMKLKEV